MSFIYNRLLAGQGGALRAGQGGALILSTPGQSPGAMNLSQMQAKVWHLLRINGPANGFPPPTDPNSDFPPSLVAQDLTLAQAQFIADTGFRPKISDRMEQLPVLALLDQPVPPSLISLKKLEYTQLGSGGGTTYSLPGLSMQEFDNRTGGAIWPTNTGIPSFYREIFAGTVRMWQPPGPGQAASAGEGFYFVNGVPVSGDAVQMVVANLGVTETVTVFAGPGDTATTLTANMASALQGNEIISGWLTPQVSPEDGTQLQLFVQNLDPVTYYATVTKQAGSTLAVSPSTVTTVAMIGDTLTWYYSSNGIVLALPGDSPGIPDNYHIALCYRVLADYWDRLEDAGQSDRYLKKYENAVVHAKAFNFDADQDVQPTLAGEEFYGYSWVNGTLGTYY